MSFFQFIRTKTFFKHTGLALLTVAALLWFVFWWLSSYTHHGDVVVVPDFAGIKVSSLDSFVAGKNIKYEIIDSIFDSKKPKGTVLKQDPEQASNVKEGRTIYLYIVASQPPQVKMPKLIDKSLKQAAAMLETYGLKMGRTIFVPDQCAGCIVKQYYNGKKIEPGTELNKGARIDLYIGKGLSDEEVAVPNLLGLTHAEALDRLAESSLNEGALAFDSKDTLKARVYRQVPASGKDHMVKMGRGIDLFFTTDTKKIPEPVTESNETPTEHDAEK